jgi:hypothetical protein
MARSTIRMGIQELEQVSQKDSAVLDLGSIRKAGGGPETYYQ